MEGSRPRAAGPAAGHARRSYALRMCRKTHDGGDTCRQKPAFLMCVPLPSRSS